MLVMDMDLELGLLYSQKKVTTMALWVLLAGQEDLELGQRQTLLKVYLLSICTTRFLMKSFMFTTEYGRLFTV